MISCVQDLPQEKVFITDLKVFCVTCPTCGSHNFGILEESKGVVKCRGRNRGTNSKCDEFIFVERHGNKVHVSNDCIRNYFPDKECIDDECGCNYEKYKPKVIYHCFKDDLPKMQELERQGKIKLKLTNRIHI